MPIYLSGPYALLLTEIGHAKRDGVRNPWIGLRKRCDHSIRNSYDDDHLRMVCARGSQVEYSVGPARVFAQHGRVCAGAAATAGDEPGNTGCERPAKYADVRKCAEHRCDHRSRIRR